VRETYVAAKPRASVGTRVEELIDYILEPYANATPTDRRSSTVFENATRIRNCRQELTRTIGATFRKIDDAMHSGDSALADMYRENLDDFVRKRRGSVELNVQTLNEIEGEYRAKTRWNPVAFVLDKMEGRR
jgi:hypothetical protein